MYFFLVSQLHTVFFCWRLSGPLLRFFNPHLAGVYKVFLSGSSGRLHSRHFAACSGFLHRLLICDRRLSWAAVAGFKCLFSRQILDQESTGHRHGSKNLLVHECIFMYLYVSLCIFMSFLKPVEKIQKDTCIFLYLFVSFDFVPKDTCIFLYLFYLLNRFRKIPKDT